MISDQLLNILKYFLIALVWLFFLRVVRAVWVEVRRTQEPARDPIPERPYPARRLEADAVSRGAAAAGVPAGGAAVSGAAAVPVGSTNGSGGVPGAAPRPGGVGATVPAGGGAATGGVAGAMVGLPGDGPPAAVPRAPSPPWGGSSARAERVAELEIVEPAGSRRRFGVTGELTLGRAPGCGICIAEDSFTSSIHARLTLREGALVVEDLHSTNGTFVNGHRIEAPMVLAVGDRLGVGKTVLERTR